MTLSLDILVVAGVIAILVWLIFDQHQISREIFLEKRLPSSPKDPFVDDLF
jgi:hypothetical protein